MVLDLIYSSSMDMVFGNKMRSNLQRYRIWKVSILFEMFFVTFQDSAPYRRTPSTLLLTILNLVFMVILVDISTRYFAVQRMQLWP